MGVAPTGMIFIPCRDGISHNSAEFAAIDDIVAGAEVLENVIKNISLVGNAFRLKKPSTMMIVDVVITSIPHMLKVLLYEFILV